MPTTRSSRMPRRSARHRPSGGSAGIRPTQARCRFSSADVGARAPRDHSARCAVVTQTTGEVPVDLSLDDGAYHAPAGIDIGPSTQQSAKASITSPKRCSRAIVVIQLGTISARSGFSRPPTWVSRWSRSFGQLTNPSTTATIQTRAVINHGSRRVSTDGMPGPVADDGSPISPEPTHPRGGPHDPCSLPVHHPCLSGRSRP